MCVTGHFCCVISRLEKCKIDLETAQLELDDNNSQLEEKEHAKAATVVCIIEEVASTAEGGEAITNTGTFFS